MNSHPLRGVALVLAAAALWGTTGAAQSLVPLQLSSYWVGALRLGVAALCFLPWLWRSRAASAAWPWPGIFAAAACMGVYNLAFFAGVRSAGVAIGTAVALGSGPVWAGLLQAAVSRRLPAWSWWLGTATAVAGVGIMVAGPGAASVASPFGIGLCLLAGLAYATYAAVSHRMVAAAPVARVTAVVFIGAALLALPIALALAGPPKLSVDDIGVVAWLGIMSTAVAYLLFSHALRHLSSATATSLALAEPVVAFALAIVVVGERPGRIAFLGLLLVLAGLGLVIRQEISTAKPTRE